MFKVVFSIGSYHALVKKGSVNIPRGNSRTFPKNER